MANLEQDIGAVLSGIDFPIHEHGGCMANLEQDIGAVLNRYSAENASNTPDFILATYLMDCLTAFNRATTKREKWYGFDSGMDTVKQEELGRDD